MINIHLGQFWKVRVWLGELPTLEYTPEDVLERRVSCGTVGRQVARCVAVESYRYLGPRAEYGMLGAEFAPGKCQELLIQVAVGPQDGAEFDSALAAQIDRVRVGLPVEYAGDVLDRMSQAEMRVDLGPGTLRISRAAHGQVSSARAVFRYLADCVVRLLKVDPDVVSEAELTSLLQLPNAE